MREEEEEEVISSSREDKKKKTKREEEEEVPFRAIDLYLAEVTVTDDARDSHK
ncbi:MAG: hypothetical protein AAFP20_25730 [Cyanobacteria bacterium J06614_10]